MANNRTSVHGDRLGLGVDSNGNETLILSKNVVATDGGYGAANGTGVTATEEKDGVHKTTITLTNHAVTMADEAGVVAYGGSKIYDFPEGAILVLGASTDLALTKSSAGINNDWDGDFSIGTATASNNATLSSTEANIIGSTATPQATGGATTADGVSSAVAFIDGTATAADVYLNFLVDDADQDITTTAANIIVNGTVTLRWIALGDN